jgi:hypothetical protein
MYAIKSWEVENIRNMSGTKRGGCHLRVQHRGVNLSGGLARWLLGFLMVEEADWDTDTVRVPWEEKAESSLRLRCLDHR